ncbi:MAG: tetratricopeptide repeat protein [Myxococcales bacterium]|nr:tetratricopeptide repeat protein [Myxococcales bacterium]
MTQRSPLAPLSALVGRVSERERLRRAFAEGARVSSLVGPGGVGKTRLARDLCAELDGVFCDLSSATDRASMLAVVAEALDVRGDRSSAREDHATVSEATIEAALASGPPSLLVLDNAEQIVDEVARVVQRWASAVAALSVLVTSREALAIDGERVFALEPLSTEPRGQEPSDAARLFVERARATGAGEIAPAVAERVASALEGLPLAIELAAARVGVLGVDAFVQRSERWIDLLRTGRRDAPRRHETLRRTIDWSWNLLSDDHRAAFAACFVFRGGFDRAAADAVLSTPSTQGIEFVEGLVHRSLIQRSSDGASGGEPRFSLFESLRAYAEERAAELAITDSVVARHRAHYASLGLALVDALDRGASPLSLAAIERERANLHAIAIDPSSPRESLAALVALDPVARLRGAIETQAPALEAAIARWGSTRDALLAKALRALGRTRFHRGAIEQARAAFSQALEVAREVPSGERVLCAQLLVELGVLEHQQRQLDRASERYLEALSVGGEDLRLRARVQANLAAVHHDRADFDEAERRYREALVTLGDCDDPRLEGITRSNLALLALERGAFSEADALFDRARLALERSGDARLYAINEGNRGLFSHATGRLDAARASCERAAETLASIGESRSEGLCRARLGGALADLGELDRARTELARAELLLERSSDALGLQALSLHRALLSLAEARMQGGPVVSVATHEASALLQRLAPSGGPSGEASLSDDVRIAARIVRARVSGDHSALRAAQAVEPSVVVRAWLEIGPSDEWFAIDEGERQDLRLYGPLGRVFVALVEAKSRPGEWLSIDALFAVGWPGERALASAANNRVHVALSDLRRRGLRPWLVHREGRYRLADALGVRRSTEGFSEPVVTVQRRGRRR